MNNSMQTYLVEMFTEKDSASFWMICIWMIRWIFWEELPAKLVTRILDVVDSAKRNSINQLLNYPEDSAGSIMTTEYVDFKKK